MAKILKSWMYAGLLLWAATFVVSLAVADVPGEDSWAPDIRIPETIWDFGSIARGQTVTHSFDVLNRGTAQLTISRVRSTCACLKAEIWLQTLAPGQSTAIRATFNEDRRLGKTTKTIYVDTNDPDEPRIALRVTGVVLAESEGNQDSTSVVAAPPEESTRDIPEQRSEGPEPTVNVLMFVSDDCEECAAVREQLVPGLVDQHGGALRLEYRSIDEPENYDLLVALEDQAQDLDNPIPVAFIGDHVLGGRKEIADNLPPLVDYYLSTGGYDFPSVAIGKREESGVAHKRVYLAYFYAPGCRECDRVRYMLNSLQHFNSSLEVRSFNSELKENLALHEALCELFGVAEEKRLAVPSIFVGESYLARTDITDANLRRLLEKYRLKGTRCLWRDAQARLPQAQRSIVERFKSLGPLAVVTAGLIDGVNPCAFATIVFLISYLSLAGRTGRELIYVGVAFTVAVFATYFLVGLGIFKVIHSLGIFSVLSRMVYLLAAGLAFALGVVSLYDFVAVKRGKEAKAKLQLPSFLKTRIHATIRKSARSETFVLAAFGAGAIVSFLELECTGQVYLPTISFVVGVPELRRHAILYLVVYNILFIFPLVVVFALAYFGRTWEQFAGVMTRQLGAVKIVTALLFFALGGLLLATFF